MNSVWKISLSSCLKVRKLKADYFQKWTVYKSKRAATVEGHRKWTVLKSQIERYYALKLEKSRPSLVAEVDGLFELSRTVLRGSNWVVFKHFKLVKINFSNLERNYTVSESHLLFAYFIYI